MIARRGHGEALAMVLEALREHPRGLTARQVAAETGIERVLCGVLLNNYRALEHVESRGPRPQLWSICRRAVSPASRQLVTPEPRSIFDPRPRVAPIVSPGSSRVMAHFDKGDHHVDGHDAHFVEPDDFTPGAFMADWLRRTGSDAP